MTGFELEQIPPVLARHLPAGARLSWPAQGMTSEVAFAAGASGTVVLKRCVDPIYLEWLRREHKVLLALQGFGLPVPRVIGYAEQVGSSGVTEVWLAMSRLPGRTLWSVMLETPEGKRGPLLHACGTLLQSLHSATVPAPLRASPDWMSRMLTQAQANLEWCDGDEALLQRLERSRPASVPEVLIHGDLTPENVLIDESGTLSLIDWSGGDSGDPRYDTALALGTEPEMTLTSEEVVAFYSGYGSAPLDEETRRWFQLLYEFF